MRISDWSSDVCSSDLSAAPDRYAILPPGIPTLSRLRRRAFVDLGYGVTVTPLQPAHHQAQPSKMALQKSQARSEEHTSELQSLMRISYAVFCLKKNTIKYKHEHK